MAYSTFDDLVVAAGGADRLVQLADFDQDGTADPAIVAKAIQRADNWIDSHLRRMYPVPLDPVSSFINDMSSREAIYILTVWRKMVTEQDLVLHKERELELRSADKGVVMVRDEAYPIRGGAGTPGAFPDAGGDHDPFTNDGGLSRDDLKGFW